MSTQVKILAISMCQQLQTIFHSVYVRYIIKNLFPNRELNFGVWFSLSFWKNLNPLQFISLVGLAGFTLVSFPLGMWLSSFSAGMFYPLSQIVMTVVGMLLIPFNLWMLQQTVQEITFNNSTLVGILLIEISGFSAIAGWYMIYSGNK